MNRGFGVSVTVPQQGGEDPVTTPLVVVAVDERDAEIVAARLAGSGASAETLRELTREEILEHGLDLEEHGSAKALPILRL
jgi:hypothetical protein